MLEESDLNLLTQEVTAVKQKWYEIGEDLRLSITLDNIRKKYSDPVVCLREMFKERLQPHNPTTTWRNIVDALRSPDIGQSQLADQLEAKYCPSEYTNNNIRYFFDQTPQLLLFSLFVLVRLLFEGG